jgi:hypothetical protein
MLRNTKDLEHYVIRATDGEIGHVKDFYFDDGAWAVRYLVVDAGGWLPDRKVLISPISVKQANWLDGTLSVSITKEQVRHSPDIATDKPVSQQNEVEYMGYFGYPYYWAGSGMWGGGYYPYAMAPGYAGYAGDRIDRKDREKEEDRLLRAERRRHRNDDPHLRSCKAVTGYHLHATDGDIGHVSGYLVDDETWAIRYVIVDTSNWWLGHQVLIAPEWITGVNWPDETVSVDLSRASVKAAPYYDPDMDWDREREQSLYRHYDRSGYWAETPALENEV